jgi:hypothetical protein
MTETTSIQNFIRERHTFAPVVKRPGLATFIGQAAVGSFCGAFLVMLVHIIFVYHSYNGFFAYYVPFLMALSLPIGAVTGLLIWAGSKEADGPLLGINRTLLGVLVTALTWFFLWCYLLKDNSPEAPISSEAQIWLLVALVVSGVSIGLMTGSRLRVWHELVREGETKSVLLKVVGGLVAFVLRAAVVFTLLGMLIYAITNVQRYFLGPQPPYNSELRAMVWSLLLLGHFATGTVILFARMRFWSLVPLTVISVSPVLASLWIAKLYGPEPNIVIGYLSVWAMFLLTRWRQTDIAWFKLKEELRYYLID